MRAITTNELLNTWENSDGQSHVVTSVNLAKLCCTDSDPDPATLSIGQRDVRLLQLHEYLFGPDLVNLADCPQCKERVEWTTSVPELTASFQKSGFRETSFTAEVGDYRVNFRLPNSYDIARATRVPNYVKDPKKLFYDCIINASRGNMICNPTELPDDVLDVLDKRMAEEDPCADIRMLLHCPLCTHQWELTFDIVSCLWIEIDTWAKQLLREVGVLASAFGWAEADILNMSVQRRRRYLAMVR